MGNLVTETPYSEITATLELLDRLGVDRDGFKKFRKASSHLQFEIARLIQEGETKQAAEPIEKFALLVDLGIITVPDDYVHAIALGTFMKKNRKKFYSVNDTITDANFPNPSRVLKPGDRLSVRAFQQIVDGTTTSEERMAYLATQKAVYTGAQGASLVFEQKRGELPKGKWYASFDEKECLWTDADGYHRVPGVGARSDGDFRWGLGSFGLVWCDDGAVLCFCDIE